MSTFTKDQAISLLVDAFPPLPLPKITDETIFYSSAYAFDWLSVKGKLWTDVCNFEAEHFGGFTFVAAGIPAAYYFYYLPAVLVAVFDDPNYSDIIYRPLLSYKLDDRWRNYYAVLDVKQIDTLIYFFKKCQSSINLYEDVMEIDILIEALATI